MVELHFIYVVLYLAVAVLGTVVAAIAWRHRAARGARSVVVFMVGIVIWSTATAAAWYVPTLMAQEFWLAAKNLGIWMVPVGFLTSAFEIARMQQWLTPGRIALISAASFVSTNIEWLNPGEQFNTAFVPREVGSFTHYQPVPGPLYWASDIVPYVLVTAAFLIIVRVFLQAPRKGAERIQAAILLTGGLVPFVLSVFTEVQYVPVGLDLAPLGFLITGPMWLTAILRGDMLEVLPAARDVLIEQMLDGVLVLDEDERVVYANPNARTILRTSQSRLLGRPAEVVLSRVRGGTDVLRGTNTEHAVLPVDSKGASRYVEMRVTPLSVGLGRPPAQLVTLHDVTEKMQADEELKLAAKVFDTANEGIVVTRADAAGVIIDVNDAYSRLTGRSREAVLGKSINEFRSGTHPPEYYAAMERALSDAGVWKGEVRHTRADGTDFPAWLSIATAEDRYRVATFTDITEIQKAEEKLEYTATHDSVTGLPNRFLVDDRLAHALAYAKREGSGLAVFLVGLDHVESVSDALGHATGDALLGEIAKRIVAAEPHADTVGCRGRGEFVVIITSAEDSVQVEAMSRRLLEAIAEPCRLGDVEVHVTASIGIALFPADGADATGLSQHAEVAMHRAKELGNTVRFFSGQLQEELDRYTGVEGELWGAIEEKRYFLRYQPIVSLSSGQIMGVEALVRLVRRDGTIMPPGEFIPVAEESGLIIQLGEWVLREACSQLTILHNTSPELMMSVNLSARQLREIDVASLIGDVSTACGVKARHLELEITETAFMVDPQRAIARLEELREVAGVRLALDDFGTGYSSFTYVRMFCADTVKIDRSFVELLPDNPEARAIVLATIALARGLGATVVAEGPETEAQVRFLMENHCECAQGFYFSRPLPADELTQLLGRGPIPLPDATPSMLP